MSKLDFDLDGKPLGMTRAKSSTLPADMTDGRQNGQPALTLALGEGKTALPPSQAVIVAAGGGKRLYPMTKDRPKCMLEVGPNPILVHQIRALRTVGVETIHVVTGHGESVVRTACDQLGVEGLAFSRNEDYRTTNSLFSLGCAAVHSDPGGLLVLNSDVMFHPYLLRRLLDDSRENVLLADFASRLCEEEMKIQVNVDNRITTISKQIDPLGAQAENLGVLKVGPEAGRRMLELARQPFEQHQLCWIPDSINALLAELEFFALGTGALPWIEIDYLHDLERARSEILPAIEALDLK